MDGTKEMLQEQVSNIEALKQWSGFKYMYYIYMYISGAFHIFS